MPDLTLLVLADPHFARRAAGPAGDGRLVGLAVEMMRRAINDAGRCGGFDAVVIPGDLVPGGPMPGAEHDLADMAAELRRMLGETPCIVVPGNHDPSASAVLDAFGDRPGVHPVGGYRVFTFADTWDEAGVDRRSPDAMRDLAEEAARPGGPIIVVQHHPVYLPEGQDRAYCVADSPAILRAYRDDGVTLSLAGHLHWGVGPHVGEGVQHYVAPMLIEPPFRYALVRLEGPEASVEERALRLPDELPLYDVHAHTHYAFCSEDVTPTETLLRARLFGLAGVSLTEHSDQLYLTRQEAYGGLTRADPDFWCAPRSPESDRMPRYRATVEPLRDDYLKLGVEIELDCAGRPALCDSHSGGWDLRLGGVHWVPEDVARLSAAEVEEVFLRDTARLLDTGVDVLAHPFRFFRRYDRRRPERLYPVVAGLLAERGVAAEVNYHTNDPDPAFFAECVAAGVPIALGSDGHALHEIADFRPHLDLVRRAAGRDDVGGLLWRRPWEGRQ